jgi:hypothetical protein
MATPYDGKILLVNWRAATTPGTTIADLAALLRAKVPNVAGVMLKTSNGVSWQGHLKGGGGPQAVTGVTRIREWVDVFAQHDLEVHVWGVPRARREEGAAFSDDITKEADKFITAANVDGVKSLLLDVEHGTYYWQGTPVEAATLMRQIRDGSRDDLHIGLILDGRRNRPFSFWVDPWIPFVDSLHPMVYPILFGTWQSIGQHLDDAFRNLGDYNKPIVPMLQAFGEHLRRPTPAEIVQQGDAAWARGAAGLSFFRLGSDRWSVDDKPHMGEPEYAAIAQIAVRDRPDLPPQPTYTWQDVINAAAVVAMRVNESWEQWLGDAGLWAIFENSLRPRPYSGPPIRHWPLTGALRDEILHLLETHSSEALVEMLLNPPVSKPVSGSHGALIGIHGAPGMAAPPLARWEAWIDYLNDMGVRWYKQCDNGAPDFSEGSIFAWCKRLKAEGIEPIIRYMAFPQFPNPLPDPYFQKMRRYAEAGIVWAEIGNEPNLDLEWQDAWRNGQDHKPMRHSNPEVIRIIAETWLHDAQRALDAGVKPAFYAFAPTDWRGNANPLYSSVFFTHKVVGYLAQHHRAATVDVFRRGGWIAVHAATYEQPVDFAPHRPDGSIWDMTLRGYEVVLEAFEAHFGADLDVDDLVVISTEGGVFTPASESMNGHDRLSTDEEHAHRVVEMFTWLEQDGTLTAMCPWCISVGSAIGHFHAPFRHDGWIEQIGGDLRPRAVVATMEQLRFDNERKNEQEDDAHAMIKLAVPYLSQFDQTAQTHQADCGLTCIAMVLNAGREIGETVTVDDLYLRHLPDKDAAAFTLLSEMEAVAHGEGVEARRVAYPDAETALRGLQSLISANKPPIILVNYAQWDDIARNNYEGPHYVVATGFDEQHVFVHDPLFRGIERDRGAFFVWRNERLLDGWGTVHELDRPDFTAVVPDKEVARI